MSGLKYPSPQQQFLTALTQVEKIPVPSAADFAKNKPLYKQYSQRITRTAHNLKTLAAILSELVGQNIFPNVFILNQLIDKCGKFKQLELAKKCFILAKEADQEFYPNFKLDIITYNSMIKAASNLGDFNYAQQLFEEAKAREADQESYPDFKL